MSIITGQLTQSNVFAYECLCPLVEISPFPTSHVQNLSSRDRRFFSSGRGRSDDGAHRQRRMTKVGEQDGFDPVIEVFEADYRGVVAHSPFYLGAGIV